MYHMHVSVDGDAASGGDSSVDSAVDMTGAHLTVVPN
jgi:hypothetical protein